MAKAVTVQKRRSSPHDRNGCLTCRARHKKCPDRSRPTCKACERLNLLCRWEPKRFLPTRTQAKVKDNTSQNTVDLPCTISPYQGYLPVLSAKSHGTSNRHFMRYYIEVLAKILTISQQHNSFLTDFLPMAMESPALLNALIAFSAANLSAFDKSHEISALELNTKALASLSASMTTHEPSEQETNLAACLVLSAAEISQGRRSAWYEHLRGARQLILMAKSSNSNGIICHGTDALKTTTEGRWLLRNFAYHDVMGSITSGNPLLLDPAYMSDIFDTVDSYSGVASEILISIARISSLDLSFVEKSYDAHDIAQHTANTAWRSLHNIETTLREWNCPSSTDSALVSSAHAYRDAALLYLYNRIRTLPLPQANAIAQPHGLDVEVEKRVESTLQHLSQIPPDGCPEGVSLFPLFMAGISTSQRTFMDTVRVRLRYVIEKRGFRNAALALQALETAWVLTLCEPSRTGGGLSWSQVLAIIGGGLNLS